MLLNDSSNIKICDNFFINFMFCFFCESFPYFVIIFYFIFQTFTLFFIFLFQILVIIKIAIFLENNNHPLN